MMALSADDVADLRRWFISGAIVVLAHGAIAATVVKWRDEDRAGRTGRCDRDRVCPGAGRAAYAADGHCSRTRASDVRGLARETGRAGRGKAESRRKSRIEAGGGAAARDQARPQPGRRARGRRHQEVSRARSRMSCAHRRRRPRRRRRFPSRPPRCRPRPARPDHAQHVECGADVENADRRAARAQQALSGKRSI